MSMTDLEHHLMAYYAQGQGRELSITGRFYPHAELIMIMADKIEVAARKFGRPVYSKSKGAAAGFVDYMIANGGWNTTENDFGGTMHQFQTDGYKAALRKLHETDPVLQKAAAEGEGYWPKAFASLTNS